MFCIEKHNELCLNGEAGRCETPPFLKKRSIDNITHDKEKLSTTYWSLDSITGRLLHHSAKWEAGGTDRYCLCVRESDGTESLALGKEHPLCAVGNQRLIADRQLVEYPLAGRQDIGQHQGG